MKLDPDDGLSDLPPLDGDNDDVPLAPEANDDLVFPEDSSSLDDAVDEELDVGTDDVELGDDDGTVDPDGDREWEGEVGDLGLVGDDAADSAADDGEPGVAESDLDLVDPRAAGEGSSDESLSLEDEGWEPFDDELPPLDADDEGDADQLDWGEASLDDKSALAAERRGTTWRRTSIAVVAVPEGDGGDAAVRVTGADAILVVEPRTGVRLVRADGVVEPRNLWREMPNLGDLTLGDSGPPLAALSAGPDRTLWITAGGRTLLRGEALGQSWVAGRLPREAFALDARVDGTVAFLAPTEDGASVFSSSDLVRWSEQKIPGVARDAIRKGQSWLAHSGVALAVGYDQGVALSRDGGRSFEHLDLRRTLAGVFAGEDTQAPLVVASESEEAVAISLTRVDVAGSAELVADLSCDDEGQVVRVALAWDPQGEVAELWCEGVLACFSPRPLQ